ncbi:MAG: cobyrinate a,c-diamide synthase [Desulfomonilaceae bacterium]|nr:cobyrinate a,c-diamide synthase [Desulfomonilaceae bacterium]
MVDSYPRIVVAGAHSGVGKTSTTLALVSALSVRGLKVQTFKVGPDYLDPSYLQIASGRPCYNLDGWMTGREYIYDLFVRKAKDADISVIEGVMGLFDGSDPVKPDGSTAEIAEWLDAPVLLVINVHGMARTAAALVKGYSEFDGNLNVAGIAANHCGSDRHAQWLGEAFKAYGLPGIVVATPRGAYPELPSRHLGLVTADERSFPGEVLDRLGAVFEQHASVEEIVAIARAAPSLAAPSADRASMGEEGRAILGVAFDSAFHFYYPDNIEALERHGCRVIRFSPLSDEVLPQGLDGLYIGGGYPEEFAEELSANRPMLDSVRAFARSGRPIYAECGGLMYLSQGIESTDGKRFDMAGVLPARTRMLQRLKTLGYVEATLLEDSLFGKRGTQLRGHEYHYSELVGNPLDDPDWNPAYEVRRVRLQTTELEGYQHGRILAGYIHAHFASRPDAVEHFVSLCAGTRENN